jgi:hypothetical protein
MAATALKAELPRSRPEAGDHPRKFETMRRLDHAAAEVNPFLTVIAIGLAAAALTSFATLAIKDALPPITRVGCPASTAASPAASPPVTSEASRRRVIGVVDSVISDRPIRNL